MSNEAKEVSKIIDTLHGHGFRSFSGVVKNDDRYSIVVLQIGTEIVHYNVPGFKNAVLETFPITIAGGAGKLALTFTTNEDLEDLEVAEALRRRHGLIEGVPRVKGIVYPIIQTEEHAGTMIDYPSRATPLTCSYMRDTVQVEAGINIINLEIEPVIREAAEVGGFRLVSYAEGFSQPLLNGARALERLASETA
jgi:hypothetical protein